MNVTALILARADELSRKELLASLKAMANAARTVAGRRQGRRQLDSLAVAHLLERIATFLEDDVLPAEKIDQFLCEQLREKLKARGEW